MTIAISYRLITL